MGADLIVAPDVQTLSKTFTFTGGVGTGAVGQATVFTPSAPVLAKSISCRCTTSLESATGTVSLGTSGVVNSLIAATAASAIDAGEYWASVTPGIAVLAEPSAHANFLVGTPITMDILLEDITAGVLVFTLEYVSIGGSTVA